MRLRWGGEHSYTKAMAGKVSGVLVTLISVAAGIGGALVMANWLFATAPLTTAIQQFFRLGFGAGALHVTAAVMLMSAYRRRMGGNAAWAIVTAAMAAALVGVGALWLAGFDIAAQPLGIVPIPQGPIPIVAALASVAIGIAGFSTLLRPGWKWPLLAAGAVLIAVALLFMSAAIRPSNILLLLLGIGYLLAGAEEHQGVPEY